MLPDDVLTSDAGRTLPHPAATVMTALAAQFYGANNGSITLPRDTAGKYGIGNPYVLDRALRELEARGLVLCTKPGSKVPPRAAMFALTWRPINEPKRDDPHDARPTLSPSNQWASWKAAKRERRGNRGRTYVVTERYWTVPESEKRRAQRRKEKQPRDTQTCSPGLHGNGEISSPGIHAAPPERVAQGYRSYISGVGRAKGEGRRRAGGIAADLPSSPVPLRPARPALALPQGPPREDAAGGGGRTGASNAGNNGHALPRRAWDVGIRLLVETGHSPRSATAFFAERRRRYGAELLDGVILQAAKEKPTSVRDWITARCAELRPEASRGTPKGLENARTSA